MATYLYNDVEPEQPETVLTARDLYKVINGKPTKLTLYKKVGVEFVPLDDHIMAQHLLLQKSNLKGEMNYG